MYLHLLSIYSIKKKKLESELKRNIFPFLEAVYGVTGTLQKHAKSKQLVKRDERAIQEATGAYTDRKVMSIGDEKGIAGLSGGCV